MTFLGLLLSNTLNFTYGKFSNLSKNFPLFLNPTGTKLLLFFTIFQNFQSILSKFEVNNPYRYFYDIINFVRLTNLIYKKIILIYI